MGTDQLANFGKMVVVHGAQAVLGTGMDMNHRGAQLPTFIGVFGNRLRGNGDVIARRGDGAR